MDTQVLSLGLGILGALGIVTFLILIGVTVRYYQGSRMGSFRWHMRNLRLKQIIAITSLFCLAMAASYAVLREFWAFIYLIIAFKIGTWWLRIIISQRI